MNINEHDDKLKELIKENSTIINSIVKKYLNYATSLGVDSSDLQQEAIIGLNKAMETYDKEASASFRTYASLLIERQIKDFLKLNDKNGNVMLNEAVSLDVSLNDEDLSLYDVVKSSAYLPLEDVLASELDSEIKKILTEFELKVYELKKEGKSNKTIANILNVDTKSIENTLQRVKSKVKKTINY